jgi:hypothetical protein
MAGPPDGGPWPPPEGPALQPDVVVPGQGPISGLKGQREMKAYLEARAARVEAVLCRGCLGAVAGGIFAQAFGLNFRGPH